MHYFSDPTSHTYARIAGLFYLAIAISGGYAIAYVPMQLQVPGDAAATVANIHAAPGFFLSGLVGDVIMMVAEIMVTAMLFFMFRAVNPTLSLAAALARFAMVAVMAAMLFFHAAAWAITDPGTTSSFSATERAELGGLLLHAHDAGVWIWQIFFFVHLLILGFLVRASGLYPRLIGTALVVGAFGYLLDTILAATGTANAVLDTALVVLLGVVTLAEITFALWLVFRGPRPDPARATSTA